MKTFNVEINTKHFKGSLSVVAENYDEALEEAQAFIQELEA